MRLLIVGLPTTIATDISRFITQTMPGEDISVAILDPHAMEQALPQVEGLICMASEPIADILETYASHASNPPFLIWLTPSPSPCPAPSIWLHSHSCTLPIHLKDLQHIIHSRFSAPQTIMPGWLLDNARTALVSTNPETLPIVLTEKESALLAMLVSTSPNAVPRDRLLAKVWGYHEGVDTHTLETHIYRLRSKLAEIKGATIVTSDEGYAFRH